MRDLGQQRGASRGCAHSNCDLLFRPAMDVEIIEIEDDEVSEVDETQFDLGREYWSNDEEEA
eukprot:5693-Eustigmatos_ZCMA.PRE.1